MRASSGVSSLSDDFRTRNRTQVPVAAARTERRIGIVSSVLLIGVSIWIGWIVGSGRLPALIGAIHGLLPL